MGAAEKKKIHSTKERIHEIIFEADTPAGKFFDVTLLIFILVSIVVVFMESVASLSQKYGATFYILEWIFTIIFTIEYILRIYSTYKPLKYIISPLGIIDLLAILPTFLSLIIAGTQSLIVIRALRLLRVFRIFKLGNYLWHSQLIMRSLKESLPKITIFFMFVVVLVMIIGSAMYLLEGGINEGFSNIPNSIYWAIVTLTTVGYGDITPQTNVGRLLSAFVMIIGYSIIAVPTGVITADYLNKMTRTRKVSSQVCRYCTEDNHMYDAVYCKTCGERLNEPVDIPVPSDRF